MATPSSSDGLHQWQVSYAQDTADGTSDSGISAADSDSSLDWLQFPAVLTGDDLSERLCTCAAWKVILRYAIVGISLVLSGTFMTIVGYVAGADNHIDNMPAPKIRFKIIGPILLSIGVVWIAGAILIGSVMYRRHEEQAALESQVVPASDPMAYPTVTVDPPPQRPPRRSRMSASANRRGNQQPVVNPPSGVPKSDPSAHPAVPRHSTTSQDSQPGFGASSSSNLGNHQEPVVNSLSNVAPATDPQAYPTSVAVHSTALQTSNPCSMPASSSNRGHRTSQSLNTPSIQQPRTAGTSRAERTSDSPAPRPYSVSADDYYQNPPPYYYAYDVPGMP